MIPRRPLGPITRPTEIANWIMMGNNQKGKSALIVEGSSDSNLFFLITDSSCCRIITAEGKDNVLNAMSIIRSQRYPGVLALVDADFDHLNNSVVASDDVAVTDSHDIETMMLSTQTFERVLLRHGFARAGKVEPYTEAFDRSAAQLRERLLNVCVRLGYLRWASKQNNLNIRFDQLEHSKIVDASTLVVREDRLETEVLRASSASAGAWRDIEGLASALVKPSDDPWQVCCGHDLTSLLALHLSRITGTSLTRGIIEADLTLGYGVEEFQRTRLYVSVREWERRNSPRRILKQG